MKKLIIFLLSILMFCMYSPVFAAEYNKDTTPGFYPADTPAFTFEIVEPNDHTDHQHVFKIYQVLKGDLYVEANKEPVLSNIDFGDGVNGTALLAAVKSNPLLQGKFAGVENASDFADKLKSAPEVAQLLASIIGQNLVANKGVSLVHDEATNSYKIANNAKLTPGYYVVIDTPEQDTANPTPAARIITAVVGNVKLATKSQSIPEVSKSVADVNDSTTKENLPIFDKNTTMDTIFSFGVNNGDSADHDIGDKVFFTIRAELPNEAGTNGSFTGYRLYDSYKIVFHDTLSKGLTFLGPEFLDDELLDDKATEDQVQAWIGNHYGESGTSNKNISNNVRVFVSDDNDSVQKAEYPIVPKTIYDKLGNYYPHKAGDAVVAKYGQEGLAMDTQGTFYKENCFYYVVEKNADGTTSLIVGIDDTMGICKANNMIRVAYNAVLNEEAVVGFQAGNDNKVYLEYSNIPSNPDSTGNTTEDLVRVWTYRLNLQKVDQSNNPLKGADFSLKKLVWNKNTQTYDEKEVEAVYGNPDVAGENNSFTKKDFIENGILKEAAFNAKLDENTRFNYIGIDDGYYVLKETKTPHGYNTMKDRYFVVQSTHELSSANPSVTAYSIVEVKDLNFDTTNPVHTYTANADSNGTITFNVENKKGVALPATGGVGTTMFYVGGSVLVIAAAVTLVANKRSKNND